MILEKKNIIQYIEGKLCNEIDTLNGELNSLKEDKVKDTKSSAGDKFETSTEMIRQSEELISNSLSKAKSQLNEIQRMYSTKCEKVSFGALVETSNGCFLFGIGVSKMELNNKLIIPVSFASPIGKVFIDKRTNDEVVFNGIQYTILSIQ